LAVLDHLREPEAPWPAHPGHRRVRITTLSFVGDRDGAIFGLTERDHQPALLSATAASTADGLPIFPCAAATGAGKTM